MIGSGPAPLAHWSLIRRDTGLVVINDLRIADGYWSKLAGLQFRAALPAGQALLLVNSGSVHTFWMRFAIDVVYLGGEGRVLSVRRQVPPWRVVFGPRGTHSVLEMTAGWLDIEAGVRLTAVCSSEQGMLRHKRSLSFLGPVAASGRRNIQKRMASERQNA